MTQDHNAHVLWTGGWDSTYQVLVLAALHRCRVTPHYLIDPNRKSLGIEILTMSRIRRRLFADFPHTRELLDPVRFFAISDLTEDPEVTEARRTILKRQFFGSQYDWLARYCRQQNLSDLQLCIHRDDKAHRLIEQMIEKHESGRSGESRLRRELLHTPEGIMFGHFTFPIFDVSKVDMERISKEQGWMPMMNLTWFCHTPTRGMKPCGHCGPCRYTVEEGLGHRIGRAQRLTALPHRFVFAPAHRLMHSAAGNLGLLPLYRRLRGA